jgi:glycosyltransferase involved in cell wall biosynthesis
MDTAKIGGLGEILHPQLPDFIKRYRFFFNPIRYTSLGLAVLEAMGIGIPVVGLATTEMVTVIRDGVSGILHTNIPYLITRMKYLLEHPEYARQLGEAGRDEVIRRLNIRRFTEDCERLFHEVVNRGKQELSNNRKTLSIEL